MLEIKSLTRRISTLAVAALAFGLGSCAGIEQPSSLPAAPIEIRNAKMPLPGVLTGGQPTEEQFAEAAEAGYRTIINLRTRGEDGTWDEASKAEELGVDYIAIPVAGVNGLTMENARRVFEVLDDAERHPIMLHCGSGNRVGALFALKAFHVDGKDAETALEIGRGAGLTKLEETVRELLEDAPDG